MNDPAPTEAKRRGSPFMRVALFWAVYLGVIVATSQVKHMVPAGSGDLAWGLVSCAALFPVTWLFLRWEKRQLRDAGVNLEARSGLRLLGGLALGGATFAVILGVVAGVAGGLAFQRGIALSPGLVLHKVVTVLALACMEELGFRGYALRTLLGRLGVWPTQAIVAVAFGLCHLAFGWTWSAVALGVVPAALLMGIAAIRSGGLAMALGVHAGLNLAQWCFSPGAKGVWQVIIDSPAEGRVALLAPGIGAALTLAMTFAVWRWYPRARADS